MGLGPSVCGKCYVIATYDELGPPFWLCPECGKECRYNLHDFGGEADLQRLRHESIGKKNEPPRSAVADYWWAPNGINRHEVKVVARGNLKTPRKSPSR